MHDFLFFFRFALRNLLRRPARSIMLLSLIAITILCLLFIQGVYGGMIQAIIDNAIQKDCGYIILENIEYQHSESLKHTLRLQQTIDLLKQSIGDIPSLRRIKTKGLAQTAMISRGIEFIGLDLADDAYNEGLKGALIDGSFLDSADRNGVILGNVLASDMGVKVGSKIVIRTQDTGGDLTATAMRVRGILDASNPKVDRIRVFASLETIQDLLSAPDQVCQIGLFPESIDQLDDLLIKIQKQFPNHIRISTWREFYPAFAIGEKMMDIVNIVLISIAFIAVGLGIFDSILVSMLERIREFGILMAIGTPQSKIHSLILSEGLILGTLGFLFGSILGTLLLGYFHHNPIDLSVFGTGPQAFGLIPKVPTDLKLKYYLYSGAVLLVSILVSCTVPIWILHRLKPVQSLRFT